MELLTCDTPDCDDSPIRVTQDDILDAGGVIECEHCGKLMRFANEKQTAKYLRDNVIPTIIGEMLEAK